MEKPEYLKEKIKTFASTLEKFVEHNLMEKQQRDENLKRLGALVEDAVKVGLFKAVIGAAVAKAVSTPMGRNSNNENSSGLQEFAKIPVQVKKLENFKGVLPKYQTALASGLDVRAQLESPLTIEPGARCLIPTGLAFAIPAGYEIQARPRSGWAIRDGISLLNTPGTIDADYRGEVKIIVVNLGEKPVTVADQDRIAQLVLCPVVQADFKEVESLDSTERGAGGFGSTGRE